MCLKIRCRFDVMENLKKKLFWVGSKQVATISYSEDSYRLVDGSADSLPAQTFCLLSACGA